MLAAVNTASSWKEPTGKITFAIVLATPSALTATGKPMISEPPAKNSTDPGGCVPSAAVTVAVMVKGAFSTAGEAVIVVVVAVSGGGVLLAVYDEPSADRVTYIGPLSSS